MTYGLPDDIANEIVNKRAGSNDQQQAETTNEGDNDQSTTDDTTTTATETATTGDTKTAKTAPQGGQSIAQVAAATDNNDDDDSTGDDDEDEDESTEAKPPKKEKSVVKQLIEVRKELKKSREFQTAMMEIIKNGGVQPDEIDELAKKWEVKPDFIRDILKVKKNLSTTADPDEDDEDDDDEEVEQEQKPPKKKKPQTENAGADPIGLRRVELAIESEFENYADSFPQAKGKMNLKAVKLFILSDKKNLDRPFGDIVSEMYPGLLTGKTTVSGDSNTNAAESSEEKPDFNDPDVQSRIKKDKKLQKDYGNDLVDRINSNFIG